MDLAEDHLLVRAMQRTAMRGCGAPGSGVTPGGQIRMAPLHLFEDRHRAQLRRRRQHRHDLGIEEVGEGIGAAASRTLLLGGWQPVVLLEAIGGGRADRCLRRGHRRRRLSVGTSCRASSGDR